LNANGDNDQEVKVGQPIRPRVLDVGCGSRKTSGAVGMDILPGPATDVVADLSVRWPFPDNSFDMIIARHVLEHVPDVVHVLDEAWRVLTPHGRVVVYGPHFSSAHLVWSDPTHRRGLSIGMFHHFLPGTGHPYSKSRFLIRSAHLSVGSASQASTDGWWRKLPRPLFRLYEYRVNRSPLSQNRAERMWSRWLPFDEVVVELEAVKS